MSCGKCNVSFGAFTWGTKCPTEQGGCGKQFCSKCIDFALTTKDLAIVNQFCEACFIKNSRLDFSKTEKVLGVEEGQGVSILFVHGAGGCRTMFEVHAKQLAEKGFRCVLMDLPGHGSRMNEKLTLQTALETIAKTVKDHCADYKGIKPIYVGGSLGGYIGMEAIGTYPNLFSGAIICMTGQDVGVKRGWAASAGLFAMQSVMPMLGAGTALNGMISQANKNGHISKTLIFEIAGGCGMFFHQGLAHVEILKQSDPRKSLSQFPGKVLFINGSKDHRDSEHIWVSSCQQGKLSVYEGGDHFFSHDDRYMNRFIKDVQDFLHWVDQ